MRPHPACAWKLTRTGGNGRLRRAVDRLNMEELALAETGPASVERSAQQGHGRQETAPLTSTLVGAEKANLGTAGDHIEITQLRSRAEVARNLVEASCPFHGEIPAKQAELRST